KVRVSDDSSPMVYLMRILPYRRMDHGIDGLVITFVNVTQDELTQPQRARRAASVESSHDAIIGRTLEGTITTWNQAATRIFGYGEAEALGKPVSLVIPREQLADVERAQRRPHLGATGPSLQSR